MPPILQQPLAVIKKHPRTAGAVLVVVVTAMMLRACSSGGPQAAEWIAVTRQEVADTIVENGLLQPVVLAQVRGETKGTLSHCIADGSRVNAGDLLFTLDPEDLHESIEDLETSLEERQTNLDLARKNFDIESAKYQARLDKETAQLTYAKTKEEYKLVALQPEDRRLAEIKIIQAELDLVDAEAELERMQSLVRKSFAAASQLDPLERRVDSARIYLEELKLNLTLQEKGISEEERIALRAAVEQAEATVARSQAELEKRLHTLETKRAIAEAQVRNTQIELDLLKGQLSEVEIHAPTSGVVRLVRQRNWGAGTWQSLSPGNRIWKKDKMADILSTEEMKIEFMVHESDILGLSTGMTASVSLPAYPGQRFSGTVIYLSDKGQDRSELAPSGYELPPNRQAQFKGQIALQSNGTRIQPGMSAQVSILKGQPQSLLVIPRSAIFYEGGQPFVHINARGKRIPVQGRTLNAQWFEVNHGLKEGQKVWLPGGDT